jgi:ankyrin repeat protein
MYDKATVVALCLEKGAKVDMENNNGVTPLMAAARDGLTAIVKMLLEAGADAYQVDEFKRTVRGHTPTLCDITDCCNITAGTRLRGC